MTPKTIDTTLRTTLHQIFDVIYPWLDKEEKLRNFRPPSGGWTINEVLEHIYLTSKFLLIIIEKGKRKALKNVQERSLNDSLKDYELNNSSLTEVGLYKSFPWIRPPHMEPNLNLNSSVVKTHIQDQVKKCEQILDQLPNGEGTLYLTTMSVNGIGKLDVYQQRFLVCVEKK